MPLHTQRGQLKALDVGPGRGSEELLVPVDAAGAATGSVALATDFVLDCLRCLSTLLTAVNVSFQSGHLCLVAVVFVFSCEFSETRFLRLLRFLVEVLTAAENMKFMWSRNVLCRHSPFLPPFLFKI